MSTEPRRPVTGAKELARSPFRRLWTGAWRLRAARLLRALADRIHPPKPKILRQDPDFRRMLMLPGAARLDWKALERNDVRVRYTATDAVWADVDGDGGMVDLREHVRRLCLAAMDLADRPLGGDWDGVAHNLRLAYSLTDLFADTDVDGASMWCSPVADYESADGELAEKHLAATVVFTFVWTAYERAVEAMSTGRGGRGARGRDLVASITCTPIPHLRACLLKACELDRGGTDFSQRDMARMLRACSLRGIAAEHLRQFRNRLIHGDVAKPEPGDWGPRSEYAPDRDPHLRRFHANTRLLLIVLQVIVAADDEEMRSVAAARSGPTPSGFAALHCIESGSDDEPELDLGIEAEPEMERPWL